MYHYLYTYITYYIISTTYIKHSMLNVLTYIILNYIMLLTLYYLYNYVYSIYLFLVVYLFLLFFEYSI